MGRWSVCGGVRETGQFWAQSGLSFRVQTGSKTGLKRVRSGSETGQKRVKNDFDPFPTVSDPFSTRFGPVSEPFQTHLIQQARPQQAQEEHNRCVSGHNLAG